jgi:hypothetical protein
LQICGKGGQSHIFEGSKGAGVTIESYGGARKERIIIIIIIIIRNGAKTISLQTLFGRLNNNNNNNNNNNKNKNNEDKSVL